MAIDSPSTETHSQDPKPKPPAGRVIARHQGKRLIVLSHRVLLLRAKQGSRLAKLPEAIEAIAEKMRLLGELEFGFSQLLGGKTLQCRLGVEDLEDSEEGIIQRGSWLLSGALGLVAGDLVFEVDDFDYANTLGKRYVGEQAVSIRPSRIKIDETVQTLQPIVITPEDERPEPSNPILRKALAYIDQVQAFEEQRAESARVEYTVIEESWRCGGCKAETVTAKDHCLKCGKPRGTSPYTSARVTLTAADKKILIKQGDQVVVRTGEQELRGLSVDRLRGAVATIAYRRDRPLPVRGDILPWVRTNLFEAQREELRAIAEDNRPRLKRVVEQPSQLSDPEPAPLAQASVVGRPTPNALQDAAIKRICGMAEGDLYLIQGPPGTGKTTAIVEAIAQLCERNQRVLFSSHSNDAVDSGQTKLRTIPQVRQARLAEASRAGDEVVDLLVGKADIEGFNLVAGTTSRLTTDSRLMGDEFDWLILDEANKVRVSEALPLMAHAKRWVLIGDPLQLGPVNDDASASFEAEDKVGELVRDSSLYEWLWGNVPAGCRTMLRRQYRMATGIGTIVSTLFYDGKLELAGPADRLGLSWPLHRHVVWIDTGLQAETRAATGSVANAFEVALCTDLCRLISHSGLTPTVAVIAMYAEQVAQLEKALEPILPGTEVASVDSFEGREADVVILSLVRSNAQSKIGFLENANRVNVALSRAQRLLVIIGDMTTLAAGSMAIFGALRTQVNGLEPKGFAKIVGPGAIVSACGMAKVASDTLKRLKETPKGKVPAPNRRRLRTRSRVKPAGG